MLEDLQGFSEGLAQYLESFDGYQLTPLWAWPLFVELLLLLDVASVKHEKICRLKDGDAVMLS